MGDSIDLPEPYVKRFWDRVYPEPMSGCWLWAGGLSGTGYGQFAYRDSAGKQRWMNAHRVAYMLTKGSIPNGLQLDHWCRTRACCNPDHLEAVTALVNMHRKGLTGVAVDHAQKDVCPKCCGPYSVVKSSHPKGSQRICRPCNAEYKRRWERERRLTNAN